MGMSKCPRMSLSTFDLMLMMVSSLRGSDIFLTLKFMISQFRTDHMLIRIYKDEC